MLKITFRDHFVNINITSVSVRPKLETRFRPFSSADHPCSRLHLTDWFRVWSFQSEFDEDKVSVPVSPVPGFLEMLARFLPAYPRYPCPSNSGPTRVWWTLSVIKIHTWYTFINPATKFVYYILLSFWKNSFLFIVSTLEIGKRSKNGQNFNVFVSLKKFLEKSNIRRSIGGLYFPLLKNFFSQSHLKYQNWPISDFLWNKKSHVIHLTWYRGSSDHVVLQ